VRNHPTAEGRQAGTDVLPNTTAPVRGSETRTDPQKELELPAVQDTSRAVLCPVSYSRMQNC